MKYFSGFLLHNEADLFQSYFTKSDTTIVGFSYGAQKAFEYVYHTKNRVDRLILLSPAFFQTQNRTFIRAQLRYYQSNQQNYIEQFLRNIQYPATINILHYLTQGTKEDLNRLLSYQWSQDKIKTLLDKKITIEVFLGSEDKIININDIQNYFSATTIYTIKGAGHILRSK